MAARFSRRLVLSLRSEGYSLSHPRACFENLLERATVDASSTQDAQHPALNAIDGYTYDYWRPATVDAWIRGILPSAEDVDFVGIAAHTLGSTQCSFVLQYWDGSGWINCHEVIRPVDDSVIMVFFPTVFSNQFRLYVLDGNVPSIGVLYVGRAFVFPQKFYVGHAPITLSRETKFKNNVSDGGLDLGRTIMRDGAETSVEIKHLRAAWVRSQLVPVLDIIDTRAFFFAWRPLEYPSEVGYVWTTSRPSPVNTGPADMMAVTFQLRGMVE